VTPKHLVIDACVARSAGETEHPVSSCCRKCLLAVQESGNFLVMTPEIAAEWKRHKSRFATTWRASMTARKRVIWLKDSALPSLRKRAGKFNESRCRAVIDKDLHLVEAALASHRTIVSRDGRAGACFRLFAKTEASIRDVAWICPVQNEDHLHGWLKQGRPSLATLCLG
jgi:hypothetical protein